MKLKDKERFWEKPMYLPYVHSTLTDEKLQEFEQKIGYKLPKSLVELLKIQNGGYTRYGLPQSGALQLWGIGENYPNLFAIKEEIDSWMDNEYYEESPISFPVEGLIAFNGDGHYYDCLDYRKNPDNPAVTYIEIDNDSEEVIAESFDEFLEMLHLEIEDLYIINPENKSLSEIVKFLEENLTIKFIEYDDSDYGYESYTAKYGGANLFFSPNEVRRAFAREGEDNFDKMKDYEGQMALRFPEIPEDSIIILCYQKELIEKMEKELAGKFSIITLSGMI